jgi:hypothetical protein
MNWSFLWHFRQIGSGAVTSRVGPPSRGTTWQNSHKPSFATRHFAFEGPARLWQSVQSFPPNGSCGLTVGTGFAGGFASWAEMAMHPQRKAVHKSTLKNACVIQSLSALVRLE